ncbi:MAG: hypothetical protein KAX20_05325 [Candidatus Omnitrophica bacterium]|nr:hypothetical protein [Candidatus Omnitrophota bacterium]
MTPLLKTRQKRFAGMGILMVVGCALQIVAGGVFGEEEFLPSSPAYPCYFLSGEPVLDGRVEEAIWDKIPSATGFFLLGSDDYASKRQISFKAFYNREALYLGVICKEPEMEKIKALYGSGGSVFSENSIEVFILSKNVKRYCQFAVDIIGSRWSGKNIGGAPIDSWKGGREKIPLPLWQAKTYQGKDYWSAELKIPFKVLGKRPENKEIWAANISRNIITDPAIGKIGCGISRGKRYKGWERFTNWAQVWGGNHEP